MRVSRPSLFELDSALNDTLRPQLESLTAQRRLVHQLILLGFAGAGLAMLLIRWGFFDSQPALFPLSLGLLGGLPWYFAFRRWGSYRTLFKERIMKPIATRFFPDLAYLPDGKVERSFYDESGLFRQSLDTYRGNDHFQGRLNEVDFEFSELLCQYTTGSGKHRRTVTEFRGFFFVGDFHRPIYFRTMIQPDQAERWLGVMGRGIQRIESGGRLVDLEDPEFEKLFVVTSEDQVEARYILTPLFMEKIREFRARAGSDIHLAFVNGRMMLAIEKGRDYFEPKLLGALLDRKDLMEFIDMLTLLTGVAEEFLHHPKFGENPPKLLK